MSKWIGAAAWSAKEARAGDRLPYARLLDENTVLLRDGSVMMALQVPGLLFETEDSDALNAHAATREVMLRSNLDARFVMYHHVIRRRVEIELEASFDDPLSAHIDRRWRERLSSGSLFINDQFVTLVRRPARGKAGLAERAAKLWKRTTGGRSSELPEADPKDVRSLRAAAGALIASLGEYGATLLGDYQGNSGHTNNELLELAQRALQRRNAPGSPPRRRNRYRPHAALSPGQLRARRDRAARIGGGTDLRIPAEPQGLSRRDRHPGCSTPCCGCHSKWS